MSIADGAAVVTETLDNIVNQVSGMTGENKSVATVSDDGDLPLDHKYNIFYSKRGGSMSAKVAAKDKTEYENMIKPIGTFNTVQSFWANYNHMVRSSELPSVDLSVFVEGIKPVWEDEANKNGGRFLIRLKKGLSARCWELLLLALVGGQFDVPTDEICGVNLSIRYNEDIISMWIRTAKNPNYRHRIKETLERLLMIPPFCKFEFKRHFEQKAMKKMVNAGKRSRGSRARSGDVRLEHGGSGDRRRDRNHSGERGSGGGRWTTAGSGGRSNTLQESGNFANGERSGSWGWR
eukprot:g1600.t1